MPNQLSSYKHQPTGGSAKSARREEREERRQAERSDVPLAAEGYGIRRIPCALAGFGAQ